ncbi:elongation of very long chain fatty acids protein 6-like protein [Willisornis vidua]|uniref:Elongation of very long chain fatty acids protein 6-like protein n=1 Tax=Willisornis vidua TaxID=1566151 RepID=A0ABQ9CWG0_9PASS|nr:elongation of very long chain fatty acids protein 6-like protein [Willisornis vidua]
MNMSVLTLQEYEFEKQFNEHAAIQWMQENCPQTAWFSPAQRQEWLSKVGGCKDRPLACWSLMGDVKMGCFAGDVA